jgi:mannonate dehydratase
MRRRDLFSMMAAAPVLAPVVSPRVAAAQDKATRATRGMPSPKIKDVSVIAMQMGVRLVVVKITTDQDGLYGYGCATFTQRADLVVPAVEKYLPTASKTPGRPATTVRTGGMVRC